MATTTSNSYYTLDYDRHHPYLLRGEEGTISYNQTKEVFIDSDLVVPVTAACQKPTNEWEQREKNPDSRALCLFK